MYVYTITLSVYIVISLTVHLYERLNHSNHLKLFQ